MRTLLTGTPALLKRGVTRLVHAWAADTPTHETPRRDHRSIASLAPRPPSQAQVSRRSPRAGKRPPRPSEPSSFALPWDSSAVQVPQWLFLCVDKWLFRVFCLISKLKCLSRLTVDRMGIERMFLKGNNDSKIEDFYIENSHEDGEECHVMIRRQSRKNREKWR